MNRILVVILAFVSIVLIVWVSFGIFSILFAYFALFMAKAGKSGANIENTFVGLTSTFLFCAAVTIVLVVGSAFMHIFMGLFIDFPMTEDVFKNELVSSCVNFAKDITLSLFVGILTIKMGGERFYTVVLPVTYILSNSLTVLVVNLEKHEFSFVFNADVGALVSKKLHFLQNSFKTMLDFENWLSFFSSEFVNAGGSILVFEPIFVFVWSIVGIMGFLFSKETIATELEPEGFKLLFWRSVGAGVIFLISVSMFFWEPAYLSSSPSSLLLGFAVVVLQIIAFPTFIVSFLAFVGFSLSLFIPARILDGIRAIKWNKLRDRTNWKWLPMIGNGGAAGLHREEFDFNDEAIPVGSSYRSKNVEKSMPAE